MRAVDEKIRAGIGLGVIGQLFPLRQQGAETAAERHADEQGVGKGHGAQEVQNSLHDKNPV